MLSGFVNEMDPMGMYADIDAGSLENRREPIKVFYDIVTNANKF